MKKEICNTCSNEVPLNETVFYKDQAFCFECAEKKSENQNIEVSQFERKVDLTVCANCQEDFGSLEIQRKILNLPVCDRCYQIMLKKPLPLWVKIFLIILVLSVIAGMIYNKNYFFGFYHNKKAHHAFEKGNIQSASEHMNIMSRYIQNPDVEALKNLYESFYYASIDQSRKALDSFILYQNTSRSDESLSQYRRELEMGVSFDEKNYPEFYNIANEFYKEKPDSPMTILVLASAAACLYITDKDESRKKECVSLIEKALSIQTAAPEEKKSIEDYAGRIRYRLASGEIITRKEYDIRFPEGYLGEAR